MTEIGELRLLELLERIADALEDCAHSLDALNEKGIETYEQNDIKTFEQNR